jgi:hypothetical protein
MRRDERRCVICGPALWCADEVVGERKKVTCIAIYQAPNRVRSRDSRAAFEEDVKEKRSSVQTKPVTSESLASRYEFFSSPPLF